MGIDPAEIKAEQGEQSDDDGRRERARAKRRLTAGDVEAAVIHCTSSDGLRR